MYFCYKLHFIFKQLDTLNNIKKTKINKSFAIKDQCKTFAIYTNNDPV